MIDKSREELKQWVVAMYHCLEANKGYVLPKKANWMADSESMLQKSAMHALSVLDLLELTKPTVDGIAKIGFIDHYSIQTLVRSVLESYLVFYYVFLDEGVGVRIKKLRHKIWHASSLSQRQKQSRFSSGVAGLLKRERSNFFKLRRQILRSKSFGSVSVMQKSLLEKKKPFDWKPQDGWRGIAVNTYLSETYWVDVYNTLSSTTHSGAVVSNNMTHPDQKKVQEGSASAAVSILNLILPFFIEGYSKIFERSDRYLQSNTDLKFKIEIAKGVVSRWGTNELRQ